MGSVKFFDYVSITKEAKWPYTEWYDRYKPLIDELELKK